MRFKAVIFLVVVCSIIVHSCNASIHDTLRDHSINEMQTLTGGNIVQRIFAELLKVYGGESMAGVTQPRVAFDFALYAQVMKGVGLHHDFYSPTGTPGNTVETNAFNFDLLKGLSIIAGQLQNTAVVNRIEESIVSWGITPHAVPAYLNTIVNDAIAITPPNQDETNEALAEESTIQRPNNDLYFRPRSFCSGSLANCDGLNPNRWAPMSRNIDGDIVVQHWDFSYWGFIPTFLENTHTFADAVPPPYDMESTDDSLALSEIAYQLQINSDLDDITRTKAGVLQIGFGFHRIQDFSPVGQWLYISLIASYQHNLSISNTIALFYAQAITQFDTTVAVYRVKRRYYHSRPIQKIQCSCLRATRNEVWDGYFLNNAEREIGRYTPYFIFEILTPPSPSYVSAYSASAFAGATIIHRMIGSSALVWSVELRAGMNPVEYENDRENLMELTCCDFPQRPRVPAEPQTISWATVYEIAEDIAFGRILSGAVFTSADMEGRDLGRRIANEAYAQYPNI